MVQINCEIILVNIMIQLDIGHKLNSSMYGSSANLNLTVFDIRSFQSKPISSKQTYFC